MLRVRSDWRISDAAANRPKGSNARVGCLFATDRPSNVRGNRIPNSRDLNVFDTKLGDH